MAWFLAPILGWFHYRKMHQNASVTLHFYDRFEDVQDVQDVHISLEDDMGVHF